MQKQKVYWLARFSAEVLKEADSVVQSFEESDAAPSSTLLVSIDDARWSYDDDAEFFADYRRSTRTAYFWRRYAGHYLEVTAESDRTEVKFSATARAAIEALFAVFESHLGRSLIPVPPEPKPTVFVGHGRDAAWRDLKDHLQDLHGYPVEAYETGARAGHAVRDVLEDMLTTSSFAILVMTGEDETADGDRRCRQNVIHEAGLFQGHLGFNRAIVLVEEGVEIFSNIAGIQQIRFEQGNIRATFGDVLATLRREFGTPA